MKKALAIMVATLSMTTLSAIISPAAEAGAAPTVSATAAVAAPTIPLSQGMSGDQVTILQRDLTALGFFTYPSLTGYFGPVTAQSVRSFQQAYRLPDTGIVDTLTRTAIAQSLVKKQLLQDSHQYIKAPYLWGGTTPYGFDCSGFVYFMYKKYGIPMPRTTSAVMSTMGMAVGQTALQPGDLVFFGINEADPKAVTHVGFYTGNGQFISALSSVGIYVQNMESSYWAPKYLGARRIFWDLKQ